MSANPQNDDGRGDETTVAGTIRAQNRILGQIAITLEAILQTMRPEAPNYKRTLDDFRGFDWASIGAGVVKSDDHGATAVEWGDNIWVRRSGQGKFGLAIWYSRSEGKDADGNNRYVRLITFKNPSEAEPLAAGVEKALPRESSGDRDFDDLPSRGAELRQQADARAANGQKAEVAVQRQLPGTARKPEIDGPAAKAKPATPPAGPAFAEWLRLSQGLADEVALYQQRDGQPDRARMLQRLGEMKYGRLEVGNLEQALYELRQDAEAGRQR